LTQTGGGTFDGAFLPDDQLAERERELEIALGIPPENRRRDDRVFLAFNGAQNLSRRWQARASVSWISDPRYLEDFSNSLYGLSPLGLHNAVGVYGQGRTWSAGLMADYHQLSDPFLPEASLPYNRLPRLYTRWAQPLGRRFLAGLDAEAVRFAHSAGAGRPGGSRIDLKPYLGMPLEGASWFLKPTLAWRYTGYQLDSRLAATLGGDTSPHRNLPITSVDAGLFFDREAGSGERRYLHTLEPRLFYLHAPYREQRALPLFDTRPLTFSWGQLFRDNRYTGADRQTDAHQLTTALSSRVIRTSDGHELFAVNAGQIRYFDDSRVTVPGEIPLERGKSAWVADLNYAPTDRWTIGATYQWDPKFRREDLASARARYLIGDDGIVNLSYRYRRDLLEQVDFSFLYPINPTWSIIGRYYYSLLDRKPLESIAGVQWNSCCLAARLIGRRYIRNRAGEVNNILQLEIELRGLGSAGPDTERVLRRAILGYHRDDLYLVPPLEARSGVPANDPDPPR
jgi:LPS-assembly protein